MWPLASSKLQRVWASTEPSRSGCGRHRSLSGAFLLWLRGMQPLPGAICQPSLLGLHSLLGDLGCPSVLKLGSPRPTGTVGHPRFHKDSSALCPDGRGADKQESESHTTLGHPWGPSLGRGCTLEHRVRERDSTQGFSRPLRIWEPGFVHKK